MRHVQINGRLVELDSGLIHHKGQSSQLPPRLQALLAHLVDQPDRVLSRDELIEAVWGHLEAATDDSVNVAISSLRRALGDGRRPYRLIRAVPRRGYVFDSTRASTLAPEAVAERLKAAPREKAGAARSGSPRRAVRPALLAGLLLVSVLAWWAIQRQPGSGPAASSPGRAVAVLPFADMSAVGDQGHFADGLVDRIIHMLTLSPDLQVVARTSSFAFRGSNASIREIARRLDVDAVLEGSVQHADGTLRVLAQLIDADTEKHIWSRSYDRPTGQLFALQDEIADAVTSTMTDSLLPDRDTPEPQSQRVWELVTRGRLAMDDFTLASATEAIGHFRAALELQPDNVEALIGLVDAVGMQRSQGPMRTSEDVHDFTEEYIERARRVAPDSSMVVRATGDWHFRSGRPEASIAAYRRAVSLNPSDATAWRHLGRTLFRVERFEEAIEPLRTSIRLDPFFKLGPVWLADAYWAVGRAEEALFRLRQSIADDPDFPQSYDRMATYLVQTGESGEAMRYILHQRALDPDSGSRWFRVCEFYLQLGDVQSAERCTDELTAEHDLPLRGRYLRQAIHRLRGDWAAQRRELEALYELGNRDPLTKALLAESYARDDCPAAMRVLEESFPDLFASEPAINPMQFMPAKTAVHCLQRAGRTQAAAPLLSALEEFVQRTRLSRGPWLIAGPEEASVHMLKGNHGAALDALEDLVDRDWRYYWWALVGQPEFAPLLDTPRFRALLERLEDGVREQREYFEANRDSPLDPLAT